MRTEPGGGHALCQPAAKPGPVRFSASTAGLRDATVDLNVAL
jgi:hypothetical protein